MRNNGQHKNRREAGLGNSPRLRHGNSRTGPVLQKRKKMKEIHDRLLHGGQVGAGGRQKGSVDNKRRPVEPRIAMDVIRLYRKHGAMIGRARWARTSASARKRWLFERPVLVRACGHCCATVNGRAHRRAARPDMLVCCNNICGTVLEMYESRPVFQRALFIWTRLRHKGFAGETRATCGGS